MTNTISKRDWETISAYLDGQLSQRKQARLASRLNNDRQLQIAFDELQRTRQVLRSTPKVRVPRNFILTPEMAGNPIRMPQLAPVFGWASAVASFLLVLVLVGDFFGGSGFVTSTFYAPQQDEFVAQHSQIAESDVFVQPAVSDELDVSLRSSVNSPEEAAPPEMHDELAPVDIASEPAPESAPMEEVLPESQEIEVQAISEEPTPEILEGRAAVTTQGDASFEVSSETPSEGSDDGSGEPENELGILLQGVDNLAEDTAVPELEEPESEPQQLTGTLVAEELSAQTMDDQPEPLAIAVTESPPLANAKALQGEQTADDVAETSINVEPTMVVAVNDIETTTSEASVPPQTRDMVFGIEVILALGALGTGLAWVYIRRRAG